MHDVFISYEHQSKYIADAICSTLERNKVRCWYAPRDVKGGMPYAQELVEAIKGCKIFILVLNRNASESPQVGNEVEWAYKYLAENKLKILPFKLSEEGISDTMQFYINRLHWIDAVTKPHEQHIETLLKDVLALLGRDSQNSSETNVSNPTDNTNEIADIRRKNEFYRSEAAHDKLEIARLKKQGELLKKLDSPVYRKLVSCDPNQSILDIGCNDGAVLIDRMSEYPNIKNVIGIDIDNDAITRANESYSNKSIHFYNFDCEDTDFAKTLETIMNENSIDGFDIVTLSMVILHLKSPFKVLKILKSTLKVGGKMIIRDIDDGIYFAYPDDDGSFDRLMNISNYCETTGFRQSGRQIFSLLKKIGMKKICLEVEGWNTIGMDHEEKDALFDAALSFIPGDLKLMVDKYPENELYINDYEWLTSVYDDLEEKFNNDDFVFQCGIMVYSAEK